MKSQYPRSKLPCPHCHILPLLRPFSPFFLLPSCSFHLFEGRMDWISSFFLIINFSWSIVALQNKFTFFFSFCLRPCSTWDLSSLTRDQTCSPNLGSTVSTTGPPGKAPHQWFLKCGSWVSSISITWKLVRHKFSSPAWITESENLGWGSWIWDLPSSPGALMHIQVWELPDYGIEVNQ